MVIMKNKNINDNLPDLEFNFPLEGMVIKAKTLEEAREQLARRKSQRPEPINEEGE